MINSAQQTILLVIAKIPTLFRNSIRLNASSLCFKAGNKLFTVLNFMSNCILCWPNRHDFCMIFGGVYRKRNNWPFANCFLPCISMYANRYSFCFCFSVPFGAADGLLPEKMDIKYFIYSHLTKQF